MSKLSIKLRTPVRQRISGDVVSFIQASSRTCFMDHLTVADFAVCRNGQLYVAIHKQTWYGMVFF